MKSCPCFHTCHQLLNAGDSWPPSRALLGAKTLPTLDALFYYKCFVTNDISDNLLSPIDYVIVVLLVGDLALTLLKLSLYQTDFIHHLIKLVYFMLDSGQDRGFDVFTSKVSAVVELVDLTFDLVVKLIGLPEELRKG